MKSDNVKDLTAKCREKATKLNHEAALHLSQTNFATMINVMTLSNISTVNSPSPNASECIECKRIA